MGKILSAILAVQDAQGANVPVSQRLDYLDRAEVNFQKALKVMRF